MVATRATTTASERRRVQRRSTVASPSNKKSKQTKTNRAPPTTDDEPEEYEVEELVAMRAKGDGWEFQVKWAGYDEETWEPESELPSELVAACRKKAEAESSKREAEEEDDETKEEETKDEEETKEEETKEEEAEVVEEETKEEAKEADSEEEGKPTQPSAVKMVCATCGEGPDGVGRKCNRCEKPMHHFCATDVCASLTLTDESGRPLEEFPDDACFCSKACYWNRGRSLRASAARMQPRSSKDDQAKEVSEFEEASECEGGGVQETLRHKKPAPRKPAPRKPARKKTTKSSSRQPLAKKPKQAEPSKNKAADAGQPGSDRDPLIGKSVAYLVDHEDWMPDKLYANARGFLLSGRVFKPKAVNRERLPSDVYEIRWCNTEFQGVKFIHRVRRETVVRGIEKHANATGSALSKLTWQKICQAQGDDISTGGDSLDDYEILEESRFYETHQMLPENLEQIEQLKSLDFQAGRVMKEPRDLYTHEDGSWTTQVKKKYKERFETASSSFFAYLPLSFWNKVVSESNTYAEAQKKPLITLDEMMTMLGIMFYMTVIDKGEYSNYWGEQVEEKIFGVGGTSLDGVMSLRRFKFLRKNLCFRFDVTLDDLKKDPMARIRPLINMLKHTSPLYVNLGRNVAVDESSIACRSKYGRHLIVYNSSKPTGKFHFKIYACCCATSWLMVGFRLHCASDMEDRLRDVVSTSEARKLQQRLQYSSEIRKHVLEVTRPLHGSKRIVNTDNFYTSVTLLMSLKEVGMYGRGTVRENSKHFPKAHMFHKKANEPRGSLMQGVSSSHNIVAASWMDGNAVNIISNADASEQGQVTRLIGKEPVVFPAPKCIVEYNQHMQGVDRLDQLRAKYSLADGHSFKKWHKKLALAIIDIARCNAYVTRCMVMENQSRNAHRDFMVELAAELITGKWKATVQDEGFFFADPQTSSMPSTPTSTSGSARTPTTPSTPIVQACSFVLSSEQFPDATRGKRGCKVCLFEGRYETMKTNYCLQHNVCLCSSTYPVDPRYSSVVCPHEDWSCWRKFHDYYLPNGLFNKNGRIQRASSMNKARRQLQMEGESVECPAAMESEIVESPATLVVSPFVATEESEVSFQEYVPEQHPNTPAFSSTSIDFAS